VAMEMSKLIHFIAQIPRNIQDLSFDPSSNYSRNFAMNLLLDNSGSGTFAL